MVTRPLHPGRLLAKRYAVERMLSKGGMGAIYLATDRQTGRQVVVKGLIDYFDAADPRAAHAARQRFAQEAETLAQLNHPCIPRTVGTFEDGAQLFLVMEYIAGADLDRRLSHTTPNGERAAGQPIPLADVLRWGVALCRVLEYLATRARPVIHHDIKPANVLVGPAADTIHLVDFGTARARLDAGGAVGLEHSSLYGTVGYAPPEQYRGRSEPRSDVYALAATLYHLASDDDPSDHPFSFPRLAALGGLGEALRDALDMEVSHRPDAADLRRRLEALLVRCGAGLLRAPDGSWLEDEDALVGWCLREWGRAAAWLRDGLPDQVGRWWDDRALEAALRRVVEAEPDADVALDRALALLDPAGVGRERPQLACDTPDIDFGQLPSSVLRRDILIENVGRRHVVLYVFLPRWLGGKSGLLTLAPGKRTMLSLAPDLSRVYLGGRLRGEVLVRDHYGRGAVNSPLLRLPVRATVPRRYILSRYGLPLGGAGLALLVWLGAGLPLPQPDSPALPAVLVGDLGSVGAPPADEAAALRAAREFLARGDFQAARTTLIGSLDRHGESGAVRDLLHETLYREAVLLVERGDWEGRRAALQTLLANTPAYRDAPQLLAETYRRAARSALGREDLAGARLELEALLARPEGGPGDAALHREVVEGQARRAAEDGDWQAAARHVLTLWEIDPANDVAAELVASDGRLGQAVAQHRRATWSSGRARVVLRLAADPMATPSVSRDGSLLTLHAPGDQARFYRIANGALLAAVPRQAPAAVSAPDAPRASVGADGSVTVWPARGRVGLTHLADVNAAASALSADGSTLAVVAADGSVTIYRPAP
jgi:tRNA A-37 threonylcarbamoyl transferase component Bud32/tetratricopeptide (TPR) repeat protein